MKWISFLGLMGCLWTCQTASNPYYGFLFKVSGNGLLQPSYIYGSNHLICDTQTSGLEAVLPQIKGVKFIGFETDPNHSNDPKTIYNTLWQKSLIPQLGSLPTNEQNYFTKQLNQYDSPQDWLAYKPIDAYLWIQSQNKPLCQGYTLVNSWFWQQANSQSWAMAPALETSEIQLKILHQSVDWTFMKAWLNTSPNQKKQLESLLQDAHWDQNFIEADKLFNAHYAQSLESNRLLIPRNQSWMPIMLSQFKQSPSLYVVGTLHLLGGNGLIHQFKQMGYSVELIQ